MDKGKAIFNNDGDSFPLLPAADVKDWNSKAGIQGTKPSYTGPAYDTTGWPDDSVTGDANCGF